MDQMHQTSISVFDLEKQQDNALQKPIIEHANEINLTIVVDNGDSNLPNKTAESTIELSRNSSFHDQFCRVCLQEREEPLITLGCKCRGGLAKAHRSCIDTWFQTKGSNRCEICQSLAINVPPPPPETQPSSTTDSWFWRTDPNFIQQDNNEIEFTKMPWLVFSILLGLLILDISLSITYGLAALPANLMVALVLVLWLGPVLTFFSECYQNWRLGGAPAAANTAESDSNATANPPPAENYPRCGVVL